MDRRTWIGVHLASRRGRSNPHGVLQTAEFKAVGDDVPKVDGAVAVGEDLQFQRRWWKFECVVWSLFVLVLLADASGILGRGPLAKAERRSRDGTLVVKYERVQRENILHADHSSRAGCAAGWQAAVVCKRRRFEAVWRAAGDSGPETSAVGDGGVTCTFAATGPAMTVQMDLKPVNLGTQHFSVAVRGGQRVQAETLVLP